MAEQPLLLNQELICYSDDMVSPVITQQMIDYFNAVWGDLDFCIQSELLCFMSEETPALHKVACGKKGAIFLWGDDSTNCKTYAYTCLGSLPPYIDFKPTILFKYSPDAIHAIIAHELAHIYLLHTNHCSHDDWRTMEMTPEQRKEYFDQKEEAADHLADQWGFDIQLAAEECDRLSHVYPQWFGKR